MWGFLCFSHIIKCHKMISDLVFEEKGYPIIKIFKNHFEIKAIDFWNFRRFEYSELTELKIENPFKKLVVSIVC